MAHMRKILALVTLLLLGAPAAAQIPQFPQTLPPNTVLGRIGQGVAGPVEAIPFGTLLSPPNFNGGVGASAITFWRGDGTWATPSAGGLVAGSPTQLQYNNAGIFGASPNLTFVSPELTIGS